MPGKGHQSEQPASSGFLGNAQIPLDFTPPRPAKLRKRWLGTRKKSRGYQDHHSLSCSSKDLNFKAFSTEKNQVPAQLPRITRRFHQLWPHRRLCSPAHSCPSPSLLLPLPCPTQEPRTHPSHQPTPLAARLQDAVWTPVADLGRHMPAPGRTSSSALACRWHWSSAPTVPRMPGEDCAATESHVHKQGHRSCLWAVTDLPAVLTCS